MQKSSIPTANWWCNMQTKSKIGVNSRYTSLTRNNSIKISQHTLSFMLTWTRIKLYRQKNIFAHTSLLIRQRWEAMDNCMRHSITGNFLALSFSCTSVPILECLTLRPRTSAWNLTIPCTQHKVAIACLLTKRPRPSAWSLMMPLRVRNARRAFKDIKLASVN